MIGLSTRIKLVMLGVIVFGVTLFVVVNFTDAARLEAVTLDGEPVNDFVSRLGLHDNRTSLKQPVDSLCKALLSDGDIVKVDVSYGLPHTIEVRTNCFDPACFALDKRSGQLLGLTDEGRVVPVPTDQSDWERPLITGIGTGALYGYCNDVRVNIVVQQLAKLREDHSDFYRLVAELDFSKKQYVLATISGLPYQLRLGAENLLPQLTEFICFIEQYSPDLSNTRLLDMRFDEMIIQVGEGS